MSFSEAQKRAIRHKDGPALVLAGPGSGKTTVITNRVRYLTEKYGVQAGSILVITFTRAAAREMKERYEKMTGQGSRVAFGTFHSVFFLILKLAYGYQASNIVREEQRIRFIREQAERMQLDLEDPAEFTASVLSEISMVKGEMMPLAHYYPKSCSEEVFKALYEGYEDQMRREKLLDFDDMLSMCYELFKARPDILTAWQKKYQYILIDEFQDINRVQYEIVKMLALPQNNLFIVGDDDQSIYRFRGARPELMLGFEKDYPEAERILLDINYRSVSTITESAGKVISNNKTRFPKEICALRGTGRPVDIRLWPDPVNETLAIVSQLRDYAQMGIPYEEIAVLYRTNAQSRLFEEKCLLYNVPYRLVGGVNFYQRKEIKDILAYLRTIANGRDDVSVMRIINVPKRGIGAASVSKAEIFASANGYSMYDAFARVRAIPSMGKAADKIQKFVDLIEEFREKISGGEYGIPELIEDVLERTGYKADLESEGEVEAETRLENIEELVNKAAAYEAAAEEPSLGEFLEEVALVADVDRMDDSDDRVTLMTLHSAKGLEFDNVWLCGLGGRAVPSMMSINSDDPGAIEEERRLCYVGITRARKRLTLTAARQRMVNGETRWNKVSRFVDEIPEEDLDESRLETRFSGKSISFDDSGLPWNRPARPAGVSTFGKGENAYASRTASFSSGAAPGFGKAFTVTKADRLEYGVGDRVHHIKFGDGTVKEIKDGGKDYEVTVEFDTAGQKRMFASFAKLKKL